MFERRRRGEELQTILKPRLTSLSPKLEAPLALDLSSMAKRDIEFEDTDVTRLRLELHTARTEAVNLRGQLQAAEMEIEAARDRTRDVQQQSALVLDAISYEVERLQRQVAEATAEADRLRKRHHEELQLMVMSAREKEVVHNARERELEEEVRGLTKQLEQLQEDLMLAEKYGEEQQSVREEADERIQILEGELEMAHTQLDGLQERVEEDEEELDRMEQELQTVRHRAEELGLRATSLAGELESARADVERERELCQMAERVAEEEVKRRLQAERECAAAVRELARVREDADALQKWREEEDEAVSELQEQLEAAMRLSAHREEEFQKAKAEADRGMAELRAKAGAAEAAAAAAACVVAGLRDEKEGLKEESKRLFLQLQRLGLGPAASGTAGAGPAAVPAGGCDALGANQNGRTVLQSAEMTPGSRPVSAALECVRDSLANGDKQARSLEGGSEAVHPQAAGRDGGLCREHPAEPPQSQAGNSWQEAHGRGEGEQDEDQDSGSDISFSLPAPIKGAWRAARELAAEYYDGGGAGASEDELAAREAEVEALQGENERLGEEICALQEQVAKTRRLVGNYEKMRRRIMQLRVCLELTRKVVEVKDRAMEFAIERARAAEGRVRELEALRAQLETQLMEVEEEEEEREAREAAATAAAAANGRSIASTRKPPDLVLSFGTEDGDAASSLGLGSGPGGGGEGVGRSGEIEEGTPTLQRVESRRPQRLVLAHSSSNSKGGCSLDSRPPKVSSSVQGASAAGGGTVSAPVGLRELQSSKDALKRVMAQVRERAAVVVEVQLGLRERNRRKAGGGSRSEQDILRPVEEEVMDCQALVDRTERVLGKMAVLEHRGALLKKKLEGRRNKLLELELKLGLSSSRRRIRHSCFTSF